MATHPKAGRFYPRTLIFLHLPKAAGTTLQDIVLRHYRGGRGYRFTGLPARLQAFKDLPEAERADHDFLAGHVHFGIHRWVPGPCTYMTMLRDPVDRVVSYYHFVLQHPEHYLHRVIRSRGYTLRECVERRVTIELDNDQTRYLTLREHAEIPFGGVTRGMFEDARGALETYFPVVGVAERFDESLVYLQCRFGWLDISYRRRNVTRERPSVEEIEPATRDLILEMNRWDAELHAFACGLLERRIAALGESFRRRMEAFSAAAAAAPPRSRAALH